MKSQTQQSPKSNIQRTLTQDNKQSKVQQQLNRNFSNILPPGIEGNTYGYLFAEIGNLEWLILDGHNYLEGGVGSTSDDQKGVFTLFVNIKFWGDSSNGVYLKFANGMKKKEQVINKFKFDVKVPEPSFEKYLDDCGQLVINIYDSNQKLKHKMMMHLCQKLENPFNPKGLQPRQQVNLEDSFIQNERLAQDLSKEEKNKKINLNAFSDDRIPTSLKNKQNPHEAYNKDAFQNDYDERPVRQVQNIKTQGKENQRNLINTDESEDTFHNQQEFDRLLARCENLGNQMDNALDSKTAFETLHGVHTVPKKYVPPFLLQEERKQNIIDEDELDNLYAIEIEGATLQHSAEKQNNHQQNSLTSNVSQNQSNSVHIKDMKYIKMKIITMKIDNEELLHNLIDTTFNLIIELPLPDIYQKKITYQQIKLNNYDIVSFNEFQYNSMTLYNFKIDEETFNQLVQSQIKVSLEGQQTTGTLNMNRILLANNYKLQVSIPLERKVFVEVDKKRTTSVPKIQSKKTIDPKSKKEAQKQTQVKEVVKPQEITKIVGHILLEINLQRGDTEEELSRDYQLRLKALEEQKSQEDIQRQKEVERKLKFSQQQEPVFATLYINIDQIRNVCINSEGTFVQNNQNETFNQRQTQGAFGNQTLNQVSNENQDKLEFRRNLYVQYKAFPSLEKLKTNVVFNEKDPRFGYRSQFPLLMSPELLEKLLKFMFVMEVWDQVTPAKEEFLGLVKIPLASFCYAMKTNDEQVFSLNFLADQHCIYPLVVSDDFLPIYSPKTGMNVGELKVTVALGTPQQINRQIQKEQEQEKTIMQMTFQQQLENTLKLKVEQEQLQQQLKQKEEDDFRRRLIEEEEKKREVRSRSATPEREAKPQQENLLGSNIANFLRQSLNLQASKGDFDLRKMTFINCLRKLFEEARTSDIQEINDDEIFKNVNKNFEGCVKQDDFIYSILNKQEFSLTRTELSNICQIMLNINRDDNNYVDIDEIQMSYRAYLKYYELIEQRIVDLLEKFRVNISKKLEQVEEIEQLTTQIEQNAQESKLQLNDFKQLLESNGMYIRDALYDQLSVYFDLDRNGNIYIQSFCEYMRNPSMRNFNFFKVNPAILNNQISEFVKNAVETNRESLQNLENEFKVELYRQKTKVEEPNIQDIPEDFLVNERINAKIFSFKLKRQGIVLTLWEVFSIFEHLNTHYAKMFYEPQRYHQITFGLFYKFITNEDYEQKIQKQQQMVKASMDSVFGLAQAINKKKGHDGSSEEGLYSDSNVEEEEEVIIQKEKKSPKKQEVKKKNVQNEVTFEKNSLEKNELVDKSIQMEKVLDEDEIQRRLSRPFRTIKHIFEIKVKELKNIPILDRLIKDQNLTEKALTKSPKKTQKSPRSNQQSVIQNIAVKYSFPLDQDEILESDYIQLNSESLSENNQFDYVVSMSTTHNYILSKSEKIENLFKAQTSSSDQSFNVSLVLYDDRREFVIGNASLPIEDIVDTVEMYDLQHQSNEEKTQDQKQTLNRVLFIYGTTFSQRENCIIGKLNLEIVYSTQKIYINEDDLSSDQYKNQDNQSCFMHRETFVNRKIPLNAILSVDIERIQNLKESLDNIEHFSRIQSNSSKDQQETLLHKNTKGGSISGQTALTGKTMQTNMNRDQAERRRVLTQIFREGLNLCLIASIFDEDKDLKKKFPNSTYQSRLLFNTLNPVFNESFEQNVQMDTNIFEYLKNKRAVFEIRHYIIQSQQENKGFTLQRNFQTQSNEKFDTQRSAITDDDADIFEKNDYITIGYVRVPLIYLITKNNGIDGEFTILDDYKQNMGSLKLRIALNHHNSQRPLYSTTNKIPKSIHQDSHTNQNATLIDKTVNISATLARGKQINMHEHQYLLGINFVELITKNRQSLEKQSQLSQTLNQQCLMYLKFKFLGQNHQTKFLSNKQQQKKTDFLSQLHMAVYDIRKVIFVDINLLEQSQVEEAFSKPLEIQLWFKKDSNAKYKQSEEEIKLGSFFIELNELSKYKNKRIKDSNGSFYSYEGYFSLYDFERGQVCQDRLAIKLYLIKKEYESQIDDLEVLFHNLESVEQEVTQKLDGVGKGYVELDELNHIIEQNIKEPYKQVLMRLVEQLEYKNVDQVFYSTLFGLPQPYFKDRYTKRFDTFGIIEKINKELQKLDVHDNGFVPVSHFRTILDHELKMKAKIVEDFIVNMRDCDNQNFQSLDVNVFSHSFKSHIDYVTLLRKLVQYFEQRQSDRSSTNENPLLSAQRELMNENSNEMNLKIQIENASRLKNPQNELESPSTFIYLRMPFQNCHPQEIETPIIQRNSYPTWQAQYQFKVPLVQENIKILMSQGLEFEIYNAKLSAGDRISTTLIGIAYVDLSSFAFVNDFYQISGYFHIFKKGDLQNTDKITSMQLQQVQKESLGQLKLTITTNTNIQRLLQTGVENQTLKKQFSPMKSRLEGSFDYNPFKSQINNQSFARNTYSQLYQQEQQDQNIVSKQEQQLFSLMNQTRQKLESSFQQFGLSLNKESDIQDIHNKNMMDLEALNQKMRETLTGSQSAKQEKEEDKIDYNKDFAQTRGYSQSKIFESQIKGLNFANITNQRQPLNQQNQAVKEEKEEESELDREENVFANNISEASEAKNKEIENVNFEQEYVNPLRGSYQASEQQIPFQQTFNRKDTPFFNLQLNFEQQQQNLNSEREESKYQPFNQNSFSEDSFRQSQSNNIFEMQNMNRQQELFNESVTHEQEQTQLREEDTVTKKVRGNVNQLSEDQVLDENQMKELAQLEKAFKPQRK